MRQRALERGSAEQTFAAPVYAFHVVNHTAARPEIKECQAGAAHPGYAAGFRLPVASCLDGDGQACLGTDINHGRDTSSEQELFRVHVGREPCRTCC